MRFPLAFVGLLIWSGMAATVLAAWLSASLYHSVNGMRGWARWTETTHGHHNGWYLFQLRRVGACLTYLDANVDVRRLNPFPIKSLSSWSAAHCPATDLDAHRMEVAHGWPSLSLRCTWIEPENTFTSPQDWVRSGLPIEPYAIEALMAGGGGFGTPVAQFIYLTERYALPLRPIWTGFFASTLFWVAILGGVAVAPGTIRHFWRRRSGQCVQCGYNIRHCKSKLCSECGWRISARAPFATNGRLLVTFCTALFSTGAACAVAILSVLKFEDIPPIHAAAQRNDADKIQQLLIDGIPVDQILERDWWYPKWRRLRVEEALRGTTPLMWAAARGNVEVLKILLANGADPDHATWLYDGRFGQMFTPLCAAAKFDQHDAIKLLLDAGAALEITHEEYMGFAAPLTIAARYGSPATLRIFLDAHEESEFRADLRTATNALYWAAHAGRTENVRLLLEAGTNVDGKPDTKGLHWSETLSIQSDASPPIDGAVTQGHEEVVKLLIANGANVHRSDLLLSAVERGDIRIVRCLLDAGVDPNQPLRPAYNRFVLPPDRTILHEALLRNDIDVARVLIDAGADTLALAGSEKRTLLFYIGRDAGASASDWVDLFIESGIDPDYIDLSGQTALMHARYQRYENVVEALVAAGADPLHSSQQEE